MINQNNLIQLNRLLAFWPIQKVEEAATQAYGEVLSKADHRDARTAVDQFVFGKIDRNHAFLPSPGELSAHITKARNERLDAEARLKPRATQLPPPVNQETPDQRSAFIARLKAKNGGHLLKPNKGEPSREEHVAAVKKTIMEAMGVDEATAEGVMTKIPDRRHFA